MRVRKKSKAELTPHRRIDRVKELLAKRRTQLPDSHPIAQPGEARRAPAASGPFWRAARRVFWRG